ncbi:MAG: hypothetical protein LBV43_03495 [Prevotella sp.]|jgi:hypothetical protein|nr:hypothetical protein [Prevotella sp.]
MKTLWYKISSVLFVIIVMSSCLGGDSYYEDKNDYAYITYLDDMGRKCAIASAGYILSNNINNLEEGRIYNVGYKINTASSSGYYNADSFNILGDGEPIPKGNFKWGAPYSDIPESQKKDTINPSSVSVGNEKLLWSPYDMFDDNWMIQYNVSKKEDEEVEAYFYYDPAGQHQNGEALKENQIIIDIRFVKTEVIEEDADVSNTSLYSMGSLSDVRDRYTPTYESGESGAIVAIKFRYVRYNPSTRPEVSYIGEFGSSNSLPRFYMIFSNK